MSETQYWKKNKEKMRAEGRCVNCCKPNDSEFVRCSECRSRHAARKREKYHNNPEHDRKRMLAYYYQNRDVVNEKNKERRRSQRAVTCCNCGTMNHPLTMVGSGRRCEACALLYRTQELERKAKWARRHRQALLCTRCGDVPREHYKSFCAGCLDAIKVQIEADKKAGVRHCVICGVEHEGGTAKTIYCRPCAGAARLRAQIEHAVRRYSPGI